ncbi:MAG: segregation/condensation protein A [Micromonosporaceae bacterium]
MTGEALAGEAAPATASGYRRGVPAARDQRQSPQPPDQDPEPTGFQVQLANFTGPFDLLLQLISKHKLDVTEVSLSKVTDEFISYIKGMGDAWDLDEASEFLLVASTLLDLKAARLLPAAEVEDEADLALLEARDLLFARLLQYQAFKEAAAHLAGLERAGARRYPRAVRLEPRYAEALPEVLLGIGPQRLAELAVKAMTPPQPKVLSIAHVHMVRVSVREHAAVLRDRLLRAGVASFRALTADCGSTLEVVARFLALLELYREGVVGFDQAQPLGDLTVRWTGARDWSASFEVDEYAGAPAEGVAESRSPAPAETEPDQPEPTETGSAGAAAGGVTPQPTDHGAEPGTPPSDGAETPQPRGEQT